MFSTYERDVIKERIYWALRYTKSAQKTVNSWWTDLYAARACSYCLFKIPDQRFLDSRWWGAAKDNTQKIQLQSTREPWDCKVDSLCRCIKDVHLLRSSTPSSSSSTTTTSSSTSTTTTSSSTAAAGPKNRTWLLLSMSPPRRAALITWHTKFQHQNSWAFLGASIQEEVGATQSA